MIAIAQRTAQPDGALFTHLFADAVAKPLLQQFEVFDPDQDGGGLQALDAGNRQLIFGMGFERVAKRKAGNGVVQFRAIAGKMFEPAHQ